MIGSHGVSSSELFPIHAPKILMDSPSLVILICSSRWLQSSWFIFLVVATWALCCLVPKGIISVFSMLNFVPEALHQLFRISCMVSMWSYLLRYRFMLSVKRLVIIFSSVPGMLIPLMSGLFLSLQARGSIARSNRAHDRGSPCRTPHVTL